MKMLFDHKVAMVYLGEFAGMLWDLDRLEDSLSVVHDIYIAILRAGDIDRLEDSLSVVHDIDIAILRAGDIDRLLFLSK